MHRTYVQAGSELPKSYKSHRECHEPHRTTPYTSTSNHSHRQQRRRERSCSWTGGEIGALTSLPTWLAVHQQSSMQGYHQQQQKKKGKVKKGWLAVRVGDEQPQAGGFRRFVIPIAYLYHPLFQLLLEAARDTYGYDSSGPLRLPCSVDEFLRLRALIERDTSAAHSSSSHRVHAGHQQHYSFARAKITS